MYMPSPNVEAARYVPVLSEAIPNQAEVSVNVCVQLAPPILIVIVLTFDYCGYAYTYLKLICISQLLD